MKPLVAIAIVAATRLALTAYGSSERSYCGVTQAF
jgi:hypothetical protein